MKWISPYLPYKNLMRNFKKLGNNPIKKNSSSIKGVQVLTQHIGISVSKTRRIIDQIRGHSYEETLTILKFMPYQASSLIFKLVYSAARNANHNMGLNNAELFISKAEVNRSTIRKKTRLCAQGHSYPISNKKNHVYYNNRTKGKIEIFIRLI